MQIRNAIPTDIPRVIALQARYLFANLSEDDRKQGFVTTPFTEQQIMDVIEQERGLFVAEDADAIVGYAFGGSWQYFSQWGIFNVMVERLPMIDFHQEKLTAFNTYQYGPICVDASQRGKGLAEALFQAVREGFSDRYPIGMTFVNQVNALSLHFHSVKLGLEIVDRFQFSERNYCALAFYSK